MIRLIHPLLKWFDTDAAHGIDKAFIVPMPLAHIDFEQPGNGVGYLLFRHRWADDFAKRRRTGRRTADGDLIPLLAVLIDAENPDVADVMMAASVHTARHLDLDRAQVVEIIQIVEARVYLLGHVDRAGIGETAEIQPGAADHVGQRADIGSGESQGVELAPDFG